MVFSIYKKAFSVLMKKPFKLWGVSLMSMLLGVLAFFLFGGVLGVALAISYAISAAMAVVYLRGYRGEEPAVADLFSNFKEGKGFLRIVGGMGWKDLWILIWAIIPFAGIVFGVIRSYEYALTPYILSFEKDVKATEAKDLSKARTNGYKKHMFLADLLPIAALWTVTGTLSLFALIPFIGWFFGFISAIVTLVASVILPLFMGLVRAAFYEEIMNAKKDKPAEETAAIEAPAETPAIEAPVEAPAEASAETPAEEN